MSFFQSFAIFNYTFPPYYLCNFLLSEVSLLLFSIAQHDKLPIKLYLFSPEMCSNTESWHYHMLCTLFPYGSFKCVTLFPCFLFVITQINRFIGHKLWKQLETHYRGSHEQMPPPACAVYTFPYHCGPKQYKTKGTHTYNVRARYP